MKPIAVYHSPSGELRRNLLQRPSFDPTKLKGIVKSVFDQVKEYGDQALIELTSKFDNVDLESLLIDSDDIIRSIESLDPQLKRSIDIAYENIKKFHAAQDTKPEEIETTPGVTCWRESRAIEKVGLYIPGGTAPLFSTVLMLGVPAQIAGCNQIVLCSPPNQDGLIHAAMLYAASLCDITEIYGIGGSQAIAAMSIGTDSVPKVDKIFGPGNQYVTAAKIMAQDYQVAIDLPAGPSEVLVYADDTANPSYIAADLLSQAEHGVDSQVVLVSTSKNMFGKVQTCLAEQIDLLPRKEIALQAIKNSVFISMDNETEAFQLINEYAPEHFIILSDEPKRFINLIQNAGSVFLGHLTPESAGDYASGTNHTLPTAGYAKAYSGVSLDSFVKKITFQLISEAGLMNLGPHIVNMAKAEELEGHAQAVSLRLKDLEEQ